MKNKKQTEQTLSWPKGKIDPNLFNIFSKPIDSKASAIQYALDLTSTYENGKKIVHTDKAKEIFDFICKNVKLPDVPLSAIIEELNKTLKNFREKLYEEKLKK